MAIEKDVLDRLLAGHDPDEVFARGGLIDDLKRALSERILDAELDAHLKGERGEDLAPAKPANRRNGTSPKTVLTGTSRVQLAIPRDRAGTFDPQLIARDLRRFPDFDDEIVSMYAHGMSVRAIRDHLEELHGVGVSPDLISTITDAVLDEIAEWQNRPLEACCPLVFDAIRAKSRDEGFVRSEPSRRHRSEPDGERRPHRGSGILPDGTREVLGLWTLQTEGAKFWLRVMNEKARIRHRLERMATRWLTADVLIAVVDGLKGFPEAIEAAFPETVVQTCIVGPLKKGLPADSIVAAASCGGWHDRQSDPRSTRVLRVRLAS